VYTTSKWLLTDDAASIAGHTTCVQPIRNHYACW